MLLAIMPPLPSRGHRGPRRHLAHHHGTLQVPPELTEESERICLHPALIPRTLTVGAQRWPVAVETDAGNLTTLGCLFLRITNAPTHTNTNMLTHTYSHTHVCSYTHPSTHRPSAKLIKLSTITNHSLYVITLPRSPPPPCRWAQ